MRNSSLVKRLRAENTPGLKHTTEAVEGSLTSLVGERSVVGRSKIVRSYGRTRSENVGMSSENIGENPMPRKSKGSHGRLVRVGLVGN